VFKRKNHSAFHLKDFSFNARFLANYVQSDDFCFFSSRKRRIKKTAFLLPLSFHSSRYVRIAAGLSRVLKQVQHRLEPGTRSYNIARHFELTAR